MEVDLNATSSPSASRHGSPFQAAAMLGPSGNSPVPLGSAGHSRKRRRSVQSFYFEPNMSDSDSNVSFFGVREESEEGESPAKRRHIPFGENRSESSHFFQALGAAAVEIESESGEASVSGQRVGAYTESDYGVDSPMHSLSLASRSPSVDEGLHLRRNVTVDDVDMTMSSGEAFGKGPHTVERQDSTSSTIFLPRQLKPQLHRNANAPVRPSPLAQSDDLSSSSDSSLYYRPMERTASNSSQGHQLHPLRRRTTESATASSSMDISSPVPMSGLQRRSSHDKSANGPLRRTSRSDRAIRTPSPRPQFVSSDDLNDPEGAMRVLHPSPGLSQSSFPGGKQMLRYTMGYRDDCELCKNKVAGHYGHVVHRTG